MKKLALIAMSLGFVLAFQPAWAKKKTDDSSTDTGAGTSTVTDDGYSASPDSGGSIEVQNSGDQVTICHVPPGNPSNAHTITVGASAVSAHLTQHASPDGGVTPGDSVGPCGSTADLCDACNYDAADFATCSVNCGILLK